MWKSTGWPGTSAPGGVDPNGSSGGDLSIWRGSAITGFAGALKGRDSVSREGDGATCSNRLDALLSAVAGRALARAATAEAAAPQNEGFSTTRNTIAMSPTVGTSFRTRKYVADRVFRSSAKRRTVPAITP